MTVQVEVFNEAPAGMSVDQEAWALEHKRRVALAGQLGMSGQLRISKARLDELQRGAPFKELTVDEWQMWKMWLPTRYKNRISDYIYDAVPISVLELMVTHREAFDSFEIRTPEKMRTDPALFGHIGNKIYLLARWGESLMPIDEIKMRLRWRMFLGRIFGYPTHVWWND